MWNERILRRVLSLVAQPDQAHNPAGNRADPKAVHVGVAAAYVQRG